jgi:hypothetical protein
MSVDTRASVGSTVDRIDQLLGQALGELAAQLQVGDGLGEDALRVLEALGRRTARGSDRIARGGAR